MVNVRSFRMYGIGFLALCAAAIAPQGAQATTWDYEMMGGMQTSSDFPSYIKTVESGDMNYLLYRQNNNRILSVRSIRDGETTWSSRENITSTYMGGFDTSLSVDSEGHLYVTHIYDGMDYSEYATGYQLGLTTNASGSWQTTSIGGDVWSSASFFDAEGMLHVFADSVASASRLQYDYVYNPATAEVTQTTLDSGVGACSSTSRLRTTTSAVFNAAENVGYVAVECTGSGTGQGLYVWKYDGATATWSYDYLNSMHFMRAGDVPLMFVDNDITGLFYRVDNEDAIYLATYQGGEWTTTLVATEILSGSQALHVTDDHLELMISSGAELYTVTGPRLGASGAWSDKEALSIEGAASFSPVELRAIDNNGTWTGIMTDDSSYDVVFLTPHVEEVVVEEAPVEEVVEEPVVEEVVSEEVVVEEAPVEEVVIEESPIVVEEDTATVLDVPTFLKITKKKVSWEAVAGASYYKLIIKKGDTRLMRFKHITNTYKKIKEEKRYLLKGKIKFILKACDENDVCTTVSKNKKFK